MEQGPAKPGNTASAADDVEELIRIADGGITGSYKPWWNLRRPTAVFASLEDQLNAIERLGKSASPAALEYVKRLTDEEKSSITTGYSEFGHEWMESGIDTYRRPHAKAALRRVLTRTLNWGRTSDGVGEYREWDSPSEFERADRVISAAHHTLSGALRDQRQRDLGSADENQDPDLE